jgi:glycosyltransferase involved in cell wall biosynthesis
MRLLLISDFYPPFVGGSEFQIQQIARGMVARGHQVHLATVWHKGLAEHEDDQGVQVWRIHGLTTRIPWFSQDVVKRFPPPLPEPGLWWAVRGLLRRLRPNLVHAQGWIAYSAAAALLGTRLPLLLSARDYGYSCPIRTLTHEGRACSGPALSKCQRCATAHYGSVPKALVGIAGVRGLGRALLARRIQAVHSNSTYTEAIFKRDFWGGTPPPQVWHEVIPSFREAKATKPVPDLPAILAGLPEQPFIFYVGSLSRAKGIDVLLQAYQSLDNPPPLVLVGSPWPDTPPIPDGITVLHDLPHSAVMAIWQRSLFGVAPSRWPEPFGNVIHEGMSSGRAMIGTTPGGHADMIDDGVNGLLVQAGDPQALALAMRRLIDDEGLRQRLAQAAPAAAARFSAELMLPRFERLYERLLADSPATAH